MKLSSSNLSAVTAKPSLVEDIDWILGTDSTQYPLADKLRNINLWYYNVVTDILASNSNWEWDSTNKTDFPIGTTALVDSQRDYGLPSDFLKLLRAEIVDVNGNTYKLQQFDESQMQAGLSSFMSSDGKPLYYREIGSSLELYPAADTTQVTSLKIYFQRTQTEFTTSDAAVSPGFPANFHRILSLGASLDYASFRMSSNTSLINSLNNQIAQMRESLKQYYATRNREVSPNLTPRPRNYD